MPYAIADVQHQLDVIQRIVPFATAINTDVLGDLNPKSFAATTIRTRRSNVHVPIANRLKPAHQAVDALTEKFQLQEDDAREVRAACVKLHAINPRGAWCVKPEAEEPVVIADGAGPHAFLLTAVARLRELLPDIESIACIKQTKGEPDGRLTRRVWVRLLASPEQEVAAIDTMMIGTHIRDALMPTQHQFAKANQLRIEAWADQLGVAAQDLPEILHWISLCAVVAQATQICLRQNIQARAA